MSKYVHITLEEFDGIESVSKSAIKVVMPVPSDNALDLLCVAMALQAMYRHVFKQKTGTDIAWPNGTTWFRCESVVPGDCLQDKYPELTKAWSTCIKAQVEYAAQLEILAAKVRGKDE